MSKNLYPLQWLEPLLQQYDTPLDYKRESEKGHRRIREAVHYAKANCEAVKLQIQEEVFTAGGDKKIRAVTNRYYHTVATHMDILNERLRNRFIANFYHVELIRCLSRVLGRLLDYLEHSFGSYLANDLPIPKEHYCTMEDQMEGWLAKLRKRFKKAQCPHCQSTGTVLVETLKGYYIKEQLHENYHAIRYSGQLAKALQALFFTGCGESILECGLTRFLIDRNFNARGFTEHLTTALSKSVMEHESPSSQMDRLLVHQKEFRQLNCATQECPETDNPNLAEYLDNWFTHELDYRKAMPDIIISAPEEKPAVKAKVTCALSSDQAALFLRAADEMRILAARSMTEVFRSIVPHLSTKNKKELSYESVRIKSYNAEENDKQRVIRTLTDMIERIRRY